MSFPNINIFVDNCNVCNQSRVLPAHLGGCGCAPKPAVYHDRSLNNPCLDCTGTCDDWWPTACTLYDGEDIPALGIKKWDSLTKVVIIQAAAINDLQNRILALE